MSSDESYYDEEMEGEEYSEENSEKDEEQGTDEETNSDDNREEISYDEEMEDEENSEREVREENSEDESDEQSDGNEFSEEMIYDEEMESAEYSEENSVDEGGEDQESNGDEGSTDNNEDMDSQESSGEETAGERKNMSDSSSEIDESYESRVDVPVFDYRLTIKHPATTCDCYFDDEDCRFHYALEQIPKHLRQTFSDQLMNGTIQYHKLQENGGGRFSRYTINWIRRIRNRCIWSRYVNKRREIEDIRGYSNENLLFHGTTADNVNKIYRFGFDISYANNNGMFGRAIYFSEHSSKANQYVYGPLGGNGCPAHSNKNCGSCVRYLLLCRVVLGRVFFKRQASNNWYRAPRNFDSVKGVPSNGGLMYPEYAVYDEDQVYPEFVISYQIVPS